MRKSLEDNRKIWEQDLIDTTPFTNKESLRVALLLFSIAADKGAEKINIIQALSHNRYLFFPFIHKHFSRIMSLTCPLTHLF